MFYTHKNSQKRIIEPGAIYFITTNTKGRFPYFENELLGWLLIVELKLCKILKGFKLYAFCLLKDHLHILLEPNKTENISRIMHFLKRHFTRNANIILGDDSEWHEESEVGQPRFPGEAVNDQQKTRDEAFEGEDGYPRLQKPGIDRGLRTKMDEYVLRLRKKHQTIPEDIRREMPRFQWQSSFHDHIIRDQEDFKTRFNYTIWNFKKHTEQNLPDDYKFTSLRFKDMVDKDLLF